MWKHADKPCLYKDCQHNNGLELLCNKYTTLKDSFHTIKTRSEAWECEFPEERLLSLIRIDKETRCWIWVGKISNGTPYYPDHEKFEMSAARAVYKTIIGNIPDRKKLHRECKNRLCVNPHHMEVK